MYFLPDNLLFPVNPQRRRRSRAEAPYNEEYSKQHKRDAEQLSHIEGHTLFKTYLVLLYKLNEET